ncbi:hypothetical protein ACOX9X_10645 [Photobacterium leiognathi subsp. mandapamensis]|uniref:hypothetical protein n=1 Tax=Photobacterium leiognathi TaxID=553611 RepID=UPI003BF586B2
MVFLIVFLLLFNTIFVISPFFYQFSIIGPISFLSLIILAIILWIREKKINYPKQYLIIIFLILVSFILSSIYWQDFGLLHFSKFFILSLLIVSILDNEIKHLFIKVLSWFLLFQLVLAIIGFVYSAFGGQPILEIIIPSGRSFPLYLTSFSVTKYAYFIRPSGLFDEPGALSFLICFLVMIREVNGFKRYFNYLLLFLGLITLSLAHIIFTLIYLIYCVFVLRSKVSILLTFISIVFLALVVPFIPNTDFVIDYFLSRSSSDLGGSGRSGLFNTTLSYLKSSDLNVYFWGVSSYCLTDYNANCRYVFPRMGENILSPLVFGGIITSWFYYILSMVTFILAIIKPRKYIILFGFIMLFFQRPYMYNISYSLMYAFAISEILILLNKNKIDIVRSKC